MEENDANLMTPGKSFVPVGSKVEQHKHGGEGSGNFGHAGRPGEVGGSGEGGSLGAMGKKEVPPDYFYKNPSKKDVYIEVRPSYSEQSRDPETGKIVTSTLSKTGHVVAISGNTYPIKDIAKSKGYKWREGEWQKSFDGDFTKEQFVKIGKNEAIKILPSAKKSGDIPDYRYSKSQWEDYLRGNKGLGVARLFARIGSSKDLSSGERAIRPLGYEKDITEDWGTERMPQTPGGGYGDFG